MTLIITIIYLPSLMMMRCTTLPQIAACLPASRTTQLIGDAAPPSYYADAAVPPLHATATYQLRAEGKSENTED